MPITAVILAGGKSSRMGRDKAFLPFRGQPLIEHALQVVREAGAAEVLISGRPEQDFSHYDCPVLLDLESDCGPLGGIERGLAVAAHPLVLILAVDLPHMTPACVEWLCRRRRQEAEQGRAVERRHSCRPDTNAIPLADRNSDESRADVHAPVPDSQGSEPGLANSAQMEQESRLTSSATAITGLIPVLRGQLEPLAACYPKAAHNIVSTLLRERCFAAREFAQRCLDAGLARGLDVPAEHQSCFANWNTPEDILS